MWHQWQVVISDLPILLTNTGRYWSHDRERCQFDRVESYQWVSGAAFEVRKLDINPMSKLLETIETGQGRRITDPFTHTQECLLIYSGNHPSLIPLALARSGVAFWCFSVAVH